MLHTKTMAKKKDKYILFKVKLSTVKKECGIKIKYKERRRCDNERSYLFGFSKRKFC